MTPDNALVWRTVKTGYVAFDGEKPIGTVFRPHKGTWYQWIILDDTYRNMGKANGMSNAMKALEAAYRKETPDDTR